MGLLIEGAPLSWEEAKKHADYIRKHGIQQFINLYHKLKERKNDELKWGDEVEYILVHMDDSRKQAKLALRATDVLPQLQRAENEAIARGEQPKLETLWRPEAGGFMVEGTPGEPYLVDFTTLAKVEENMRYRREEVAKLLPKDEIILSFTAFPRLGCPDFTYPATKPNPTGKDGLCSLFFPDECLYQGHPRYRAIASCIQRRRRRKPVMNLPIFVDANTPRPFVEDFSAMGDDGVAQAIAKPDSVYLDAVGFAGGCCCLQVTFQCRNMDEGRLLYDQLATLCPIMLALTAASPVYRGYLVNSDCRWNVERDLLDDRTEEEMGIMPLKEDRFVIPKSRYNSVDCYISAQGAEYNDQKLIVDAEHLNTLLEAGVDLPLARHIAHMFIRDPLVVFADNPFQDDTKDTADFEGLQSTIWMSMRFKPPPSFDSPIGCRVEFRPMELHLTDFENAAFAVFVVLLTRVILSFDLNFLLPISKVEENMEEAQTIDAVKKGKFYFRRNIMPDSTQNTRFKRYLGLSTEVTQMTVNEIVNGKGDEFPGLIPLIKEYMNCVDVDLETSALINSYLRLIRKKAAGELKTTARWIRDFIDAHPAYKHDSVVSDEINYDLMRTSYEISQGNLFDPTLLLHRYACMED